MKGWPRAGAGGAQHAAAAHPLRWLRPPWPGAWFLFLPVAAAGLTQARRKKRSPAGSPRREHASVSLRGPRAVCLPGSGDSWRQARGESLGHACSVLMVEDGLRPGGSGAPPPPHTHSVSWVRGGSPGFLSGTRRTHGGQEGRRVPGRHSPAAGGRPCEGQACGGARGRRAAVLPGRGGEQEGAAGRKERHGAQSPPSSGSGARSFWKFPHQAETRSSSPERSLGS